MEETDFCYADYIVNEKSFYDKYIVIDEYRATSTTTIIRAYKGKQTIVSIRKTPFIHDLYHINRLKALISAWNNNLVLVDGVCLMSDGAILEL
jgi:hypothetical protein